MLPWLFPVGLVVAVVAVSLSPLVGGLILVPLALVGGAYAYREYQRTRPPNDALARWIDRSRPRR